MYPGQQERVHAEQGLYMSVDKKGVQDRAVRAEKRRSSSKRQPRRKRRKQQPREKLKEWRRRQKQQKPQRKGRRRKLQAEERALALTERQVNKRGFTQAELTSVRALRGRAKGHGERRKRRPVQELYCLVLRVGELGRRRDVGAL